MTATIYCRYCHHNWKPGIEYDKHIRCCEYFYKQRRTPSQPEMTESGVPIPNMRQLYRYVQDLTYRLEKTEKELRKLKSVVNSRKKIELLVWLNQSVQMPTITFEHWMRNIKATESDMIEVLNGNLTDGILSCLYSAIKSDNMLPIRCFSQKPGAFYIYSTITKTDSSVTTEWQQMRSDQMLKLANHISLSIRREFRIWNTAQICGGDTNSEYDQNFMDKLPKYVKKLNSDVEKRIPDIKKELFSKLSENIRFAMDCDPEND
jgi:hypothetical protein